MTEVQWKPWPRNPRYLIGDDGTVRGIRGRPLRTHRNKRGYLQISIDDERGKACARLVHQMVCETFHGPRPAGLEVAHGGGNQLNNSAGNLSWKTHGENMEDARLHNAMVLPPLVPTGEDHHLAVLTEALVREIRALFAAGGQTYSGLARRYGVHVNTIRMVVLRMTWKHVTELEN